MLSRPHTWTKINVYLGLTAVFYYLIISGGVIYGVVWLAGLGELNRETVALVAAELDEKGRPRPSYCSSIWPSPLPYNSSCAHWL